MRHGERRRRPRITGRLLAIAAVAVLAVATDAPVRIASMLHSEADVHYLSASDLERVVSMSDLTTIDYLHQGIAEKDGWLSSVFGPELRIRYEAHVSAGIDLRKVGFSVDEEGRRVSVALPDLVVSDPRIDPSSLSFLPEGADADLAEVLALCEQDAILESGQDPRLRESAYANAKSVIRTITYPLTGDEYELVFTDEADRKGGDR